ncbi:hypothetical protein LOZ61_006065 [Ophidiomyces ophidiicola]|nr:hypothetical protein LOZ61_006065 [Ophidiomyces ophidiicola]KAI1922150.1 hypothetical protein LOZ60_005869 [Ophidiomyces ophidiicola]KAI1952103.1 hypothetical protein LOZ59_005539 [Ophidiomyces ophidiicola]KAI2027447.1 hypothetical protein LOZ48_004743 [Ophidiomyces ophidiicola]KAI2151350.1 hypothetical protein LOZ25_006316 [Ophidiomyces ophidiicola]
MFAATILAALLVTATSALPREAPTSNDLIRVQLSAVGNTMVNAVVTNTGKDPISLMKLNTVLDSFPCERATVYKEGKMMEFEGLLAHYDLQGLPTDAFTTLKPGDSTNNTFDLAETADLAAGGSISVLSQGIFLLASPGSTKFSGMIHYRSNDLNLKVDGKAASRIKSAARLGLEKRSKFYLDTCNETQTSVLSKCLAKATEYSNAGNKGATSGSAETFKTFFKTTAASDRKNVAARFRAISNETSAINSGIINIRCGFNDRCKGKVNAIANRWANLITICDRYFVAYPVADTACHATDQSTIMLHEMTHMKNIYDPETNDYGYGYNGILGLTREEALLNADTYAIYGGGTFLSSCLLSLFFVAALCSPFSDISRNC